MNKLKYTAFGILAVALFATLAGAATVGAQASTSGSANAVTSNCGSVVTLYMEHSMLCGNYRVKLLGMAYPQNSNVPVINLAVFYKGSYISGVITAPNSTATANAMSYGAKLPLDISIGKAFLGLYRHQQWAQVKLTK